MLTFSAPARFADYVVAAGKAASQRIVPPPAPLDVEKLTAVGARFGIEIVGPPPGEA